MGYAISSIANVCRAFVAVIRHHFTGSNSTGAVAVAEVAEVLVKIVVALRTEDLVARTDSIIALVIGGAWISVVAVVVVGIVDHSIIWVALIIGAEVVVVDGCTNSIRTCPQRVAEEASASLCIVLVGIADYRLPDAGAATANIGRSIRIAIVARVLVGCLNDAILGMAGTVRARIPIVQGLAWIDRACAVRIALCTEAILEQVIARNASHYGPAAYALGAHIVDRVGVAIVTVLGVGSVQGTVIGIAGVVGADVAIFNGNAVVHRPDAVAVAELAVALFQEVLVFLTGRVHTYAIALRTGVVDGLGVAVVARRTVVQMVNSIVHVAEVVGARIVVVDGVAVALHFQPGIRTFPAETAIFKPITRGTDQRDADTFTVEADILDGGGVTVVAITAVIDV